MKALYLNKPGETSIAEIERPSPQAGEVLLRIRLVGLCGSDFNSYRGRNPIVEFPRIPGHELAATIEAVGAEVPATLRPGLRVTASPYTACGKCPSCRRGRENACQFNETFGNQRDGVLTEFVAVPWQKIHTAEGLSLRELCLVEPISVGFHAADRGRITKEDTVAVLGCGMIGMGAIAAAAFRGARTIAVDIDAGKLALAKKAGAAETINSGSEDLHERLQAITSGEGPDVIIEAVGLTQTFQAAIAEVAFTGRVVYIGYAKEPVSYDTKLFLLKELDILGSRNARPEDFQGVIEMLQQGRFPVDEAISAVTPLTGAAEILAEWVKAPASYTKIMIEVAGGGSV
ncbi:MAG: zinc-binding alcohol dehydrogenase family protein [bacterium]|nr:zinc-binding alcohol dehydrogenase family protein [bacterium]